MSYIQIWYIDDDLISQIMHLLISKNCMGISYQFFEQEIWSMENLW